MVLLCGIIINWRVYHDVEWDFMCEASFENVFLESEDKEKQDETIEQGNEEKQEEIVEQKDECFSKADDLTTDELEELRRKGCFKNTEK